jgi:uroporphyrin-III C-methyltransferase/precorrin-2 dehydrogenase/sirohydrochlorin ferrochelatase
VLSRKIKELVETHLPARAGELAAILDSFRNRVKVTVTDFDKRLRFWESVFDSAVPELVYSGQDAKAHELLEQMLERAGKDSSALRGEVYLVGAGPGDPDLLTLKALRLMHKADIVLYDRLVSKEIMARLRPDAEKIHVGKQRQNHPVPQEEINELLIKHARAGKKVLRLKGGDPFIFGRGGEELARLAEAHIPFQIVPGITAASGCASYAGIPLTHRDHAQSVQFVAGHMKDGELDLQWEQLIAPQQTLVFYMALVSLELICEQLIARGKDRDTPVAVVQQGTTNNQRVVEGNLANIAERVAASELQAPTITIIGEVVRLREKLDWFVSKAEAEAGGQARPTDHTA